MATTTFYPQAGGGGGNVTCDGRMARAAEASWTLARDAATSDGLSVVETQQALCMSFKNNATSWYAYRTVFTFNTSSIGTDTISSADFIIYENTDFYAIQNADTDSAHIVSASLANANDVVAGDYDSLGTTSFGSKTLSSFSLNQYNTISLNASGIANINKTGVSEFGSRVGTDLSDTEPTGRNQVSIFFADETGTTKDPKLVVTHAAGGGATFIPQISIF